MHEVTDPERVLSDVYAALNPAGLLVVLGLDALPRFLPDDNPDAPLRRRSLTIAAANFR